MKTLKTIYYILAIISLSTINLSAQDGTLDPTFGVNGIVETNIESDEILHQKLLPDNKLLILAKKDSDSFILRVNEDGSIDNTFGNDGVVNLTQNKKDSTSYKINKFDIFSDGKIALIENQLKVHVKYAAYPDSVYIKTSNSIIKLNSDGSYDNSFGDNGILTIWDFDDLIIYDTTSIPFPNYFSEFYNNIDIDMNDKILVSGKNNTRYGFKVLQLNYDGSYDLNFGTNGVLDTYAKYLYRDNSNALYFVNNWGSGLKVYKRLSNGSIDITYGNNGTFEISTDSIGFSYNMWLEGVDFESNNKLLIAARVETAGSDFSLIFRLTSTGVLDSTFGNNGMREIELSEFGSDYENSSTQILSMQDGKIIWGGVEISQDWVKRLLLAKLMNDGSADLSFADNGMVFNDSFYDDSITNDDMTYKFVLRPDDQKIVISAIKSQKLYFARYLNSKGYSSQHYSGEVSGIWDLDTVYIDNDITVPVDKFLIIKPGTNVYFTGEYTFDVYGQLIANGTETDSIFFFSDSLGWNYQEQKYHGHWYGLGFKNTDISNAPNSEISYTNFKYANSKSFDFYNDPTGYEADSIGAPLRFYYSSNITVSNISMTECKGYNLNLVHASPLFFDFTLRDRNYFQLSNSSNPTLKNIRFEDGRIIIVDSNPTMDSLSFIECYSPLVGLNLGGTISNSIFKDNFYSWKEGGGAFDLDKGSTIKFENVIFEGNKNTYSDGWYGYGGAGYIRDSSPEFVNCQFIGNYSYGSASAIGLGSNDYSHPWISTFENCLFVKNKAEQGQGTLNSSTNAHLTLINCTIADNTAPFVAGIANDSGTPNIITNSIIYGNGPNYDQQFSTHQSSHQLTYNIIQGNYYGIESNENNLLDVEPLFRDTSANDYHLQSIDCGYSSDSPAIDAGDPDVSDLLLNCESAGLGTGRSDIGAYGGANNWWDKSVLPSCHFAGEVSGVWECENIYIDGDIIIPEGDTLRITESVDRVNISGPYQIKVKGVLLASGPEDARVGLTGEQLLFQGSDWKGIFFNNLNDTNVGTSIIENCRFDYADKMDIDYQGGGAIAIYNSDNVIVRRSTFYLNQAKFGGAIYIENSDAHIEDCHFNLNGKERGQLGEASATAGGGMYIKNSNPYLHKLYFIDNHSIGGGGALVLDNSSPVISNIMMVRNFTEGLGGAVQLINGASPKFVNMTTADNVAETAGGAFYLNPNSNPIIINSILFEDTKPEIYLGGGTPTVTYSIIDSASAELYFGEGCSDADPYLTTDVEYRLSNNTCSYSDGNTAVSPAIDAGHPDSLDSELDCYAGLGEVRADLGFYGGRYSETTVGIEDNEIASEIPSEYSLSQNYPNPFNPSTTISYSIPSFVETSRDLSLHIVKLTIYDILGRNVATLVNKEQAPGNYKVNFDASKLSSGLYFYRLHISNSSASSEQDFVNVKKMMLIK